VKNLNRTIKLKASSLEDVLITSLNLDELPSDIFDRLRETVSFNYYAIWKSVKDNIKIENDEDKNTRSL
jgi:hypothetical protein